MKLSKTNLLLYSVFAGLSFAIAGEVSYLAGAVITFLPFVLHFYVAQKAKKSFSNLVQNALKNKNRISKPKICKVLFIPMGACLLVTGFCQYSLFNI